MLAHCVNDPDTPPDHEPDLTPALLALECDVINTVSLLHRIAAWCPNCGTATCEHCRAAWKALEAMAPLVELSYDLTTQRAQEECFDHPW